MAVRLAIPLLALAGAHVPGTPHWRRGPLTGDATGFYSAARAFVSACASPLSLLAFAAGAGVAMTAWRRLRGTPWLLPALALVAGLAVAVPVSRMPATGAAAVFGWPLLWSVPMFPLRAAGLLDADVAFWVGVPLQLAAIAVTVVACAYAGLYATTRRPLGLLSAAAWTAWPLLSGVVGGHRAWTNGTWAIDAGLHMYTEPLSTALVTTAMALVLAPRAGARTLALAGVLLSYATLTKLPNALTAALVLALLVWRVGARRTLPYLAGALSLAPLVAAYWPKSYPRLFGNPGSWPRDAFDVAHVVPGWTHSLLFRPHALALLVPLALVGLAGVRRPWPLALVLGWLLVNPVFYSFYANLAQHPRFLYASLPALFVLWAAGVGVLVSLVPARRAAAPAQP